jgi:hypothetical protein
VRCENYDVAPGRSAAPRSTGHGLRTLALGLSVVLLGFWVAACGTTPSGPPPPAQLVGRPLGSAFVAVTGSGFPAGATAVVTGTTPQGATTVNVMTDARGELLTSVAVPDGYQGPLDVRATVGTAAATATVDAGAAPHEQPGDDAGVRPLPAVACTTTADVGSLPPASPGDVVCLTGDSSSRLTVNVGGTPGKPVTYSGGGNTTVEGIDVTADHVVVEGFESKDAKSMGAKLQGNDITFRDNTIKHPVNDGDDTDGMRFFGDDITILHNTITDVSDGSDCGDNGCGDGPHPDCMQTFYSQQYPTSSHITIEGNRCENIAAQCVIAEGPQLPDEGVDGPGQSADWTLYDNYCDTGAAQAVQFKDVKNVTIADNFFDGSNNKAISLANASTGAHVGGNKLGPKTPKLITFDDGAEAPGYVGPTPDK